MQFISKIILKQIYKKREKWAHKGQFGKLLVIAGSKMHTGSPCFAGMAAYRAGCDLVYIAASERAADVAANFSPCLITYPLKGERLIKNHIPEIMKLIEGTRATAVAIGPGLWRASQTKKAIIKLIKKINLPMVIDADAIRAISKKQILKDKSCILTPHADEFRELTGIKVSTNIKERVREVKQQSKKLNSVILLKGNIDIISDGNKTALNKTGSVYMTKGGFGDTLTGICGAFLAMGIDAFTVACAAAYINGKVGEVISKNKESILPTDLIENIYKVI